MSDFEKYLLSKNPHSRSVYDDYAKAQGYLNPYIIEESQLHVTTMDVFSRLMKDRIIWFGTAVTSETANIIQAQLLYLDQIEETPISIYINSPGGECISGMGIYDTIQYINSETNSCCTGLAASFGAILLCCCTHRTALPNASIMIHQPLISGGGISGQATDIMIEAREMEKTKKKIYEVLSKHTGRSFQEVWDACERNNWMTSQEALNFGLIDEIISKKKK